MNVTFRFSLCRATAVLALGTLAACAGHMHAQATRTAASAAETRTARAFEAAKKKGAPALYAFLKPMPKGADLHMHLSGAIYAETFLAEAARQGMCVDPVALRLAQPVPGKEAPCATGNLLVADAVKNQRLYDSLIDSFSMRGFVPTPGTTGHDQFFSTFDRFSGLKNVQGEWLHEVAHRAAAQNEQYLEIMNTPSFGHAVAAGYKLGWPKGLHDSNYTSLLAKLREQLLANGLREDISIDSKEIADAKSAREALENCNNSVDKLLTNAGVRVVAAYQGDCDVRIHFLYQVLRGYAPEQVFAQTLLGFELASQNPDVVGINFVRAEDWRGPMAEYHTEMLMMDYLHSVYPKVRISLHAGELAPGMVPPEGLSFHIREAVELGHAERIGHGVDILRENRPDELLKEMAQKHIMVEINLTSNDVILGVKGPDHPLAAYRAAHVPVALSTDDEGVSRIDLTTEYVKGALEQDLTYADLKTMARTSLEHSFLPGESLWSSPDEFTRRKAACAAATGMPKAACTNFLQSSERAAAQFELENRFAFFEAASK